MTNTRPRHVAGGTIIRRAGWLSVGSLVAATAFAPAANAAPVATVGPLHYGAGISVDGNRSEWTALDRYADMYRAAKPDKQVESVLYLRYDCTTHRLAVMVSTVAGVTLDVGGDQFVKVDGEKKIGSPAIGDFTMSGDGLGWEGSFAIAEGSYSLNVHAQVMDGGSQTSAVLGRDIPLVVDCASVAPSDSAAPSGSSQPSTDPSVQPSTDHSVVPSTDPSVDPSTDPSVQPSNDPSADPTNDPSTDPSADPSTNPSADPSTDASTNPSADPSSDPTADPSLQPSTYPSSEPSNDPSSDPSTDPSTDPSPGLSADPSADPSVKPSTRPSPTGEVAGATATPKLTPPPTDTTGPTAPASSDAWRIILLGLAGLIAAALTLTTPRRTRR